MNVYVFEKFVFLILIMTSIGVNLTELEERLDFLCNQVEKICAYVVISISNQQR